MGIVIEKLELIKSTEATFKKLTIEFTRRKNTIFYRSLCVALAGSLLLIRNRQRVN